MLLAIDTSAGTTVAVVDRDGGILAERSELDTMRHAEVVGDQIAAVLAEAGVPVDALSASRGRDGAGSVHRDCASASPRLARSPSGPASPSFPWSATTRSRSNGTGQATTGGLLVVTDARRRELYWSAYVGVDEVGLPIREDGPGLCQARRASARLHWRASTPPTVSAGALGMLAELLYLHRRPFAADEPLYLRSPDVTLSNGPKRVSA